MLSELGCPLFPMTLREHGSWYQEPHSGGLGWAFPAALGMQLADRQRLVVATMGDGSYIFANPAACHQIAEALGLPVLILVLNNAEWGAVRQSVVGRLSRRLRRKGQQHAADVAGTQPGFCQICRGQPRLGRPRQRCRTRWRRRSRTPYGTSKRIGPTP